MPQDNYYEKVVAEATRTTDKDPDAEPTAAEVVADALGKPRGHRVRTGTNTYEIQEN